MARAGVVAGLMIGAAAVWAGVPPLSLAPHVDVPLGPPDCQAGVTCSEGAFSAAAGDYNGDGKLDVATANNGSDDVTVLFGDGHGVLGYGATLTAGMAPSSIASGNLNASDTILDLVVANESDNNVDVFLGTGGGAFADPVPYDMGNSPETVVLADFNHDGKLDVATANLFGETVAVRLGNGDGTFGDLLETQVAGGPSGLAAGKLNSDDFPDLAVSLNDDAQVAGLIGKGDGTFTVMKPDDMTHCDESPQGLVIDDFNNDGKGDVAVATEFNDLVDVLLGNGDGTFQTTEIDPGDFRQGVAYPVGGFPESVAAGDYNGDGIVDLASADSFGTTEFDGSVSVLIGNGNGTFQDAQTFEVDSGPFGIVAADLNDDRLPDIVTANLDAADVSVLVNTGTPPAPACVGDCSDDGMVAINELVVGVNIALGNSPVSACPAFDANGDGQVAINELITAVNNALNGCPAA